MEVLRLLPWALIFFLFWIPYSRLLTRLGFNRWWSITVLALPITIWLIVPVLAFVRWPIPDASDHKAGIKNIFE